MSVRLREVSPLLVGQLLDTYKINRYDVHMTSAPRLTDDELARATDGRVILDDVSWLQYETLLAWRGDKSVPRYAYLEGTLEITSPWQEHERATRYIGAIVQTYAVAVGIELTSFGSWTLRSAIRARGVEADDCYILGEQNKPRPDLAIEIIWTSGGLDKLEIYRGLEVPEVWIVAGGTITVHQLVDGHYRTTPRSAAFPELDLGFVMQLLAEPTMTQAMRKISAWAQGR